MSKGIIILVLAFILLKLSLKKSGLVYKRITPFYFLSPNKAVLYLVYYFIESEKHRTQALVSLDHFGQTNQA